MTDEFCSDTYKIIRPNSFPKIDRIIDVFGGGASDNVVQIISDSIKVPHIKFTVIPIDWHRDQKHLLENQSIEGRRFTDSHIQKVQYISYMANAKLLGGVIVGAKKEVNSDTIYHHFGNEVDYGSSLSKPERIIVDPVFYLGETTEYYHWIMDCLTAISLWQTSGLNKKTKLFVANITDFKRQTLLAYGIPSEMVIGDESGHVNFKRIFIPSTLGGGQAWGTPRYLPKFHRKSVGDIIPENTNMKYYISRSRTDRRPINNEAEVEKMLARHGFIIIFLEEYSFVEQIRLMKSASLIISPHGAGLTNIVYCQPKTTIIELLCERYLNCCFYQLSSVSELTYIPIVSTSYEVTGDHLHQHNWNVDISQLREVISYLGEVSQGEKIPLIKRVLSYVGLKRV